jgi:iron complex outermembrane receptor protein
MTSCRETMNTAFQAGHVSPEIRTTEALPASRQFDARIDARCEVVVHSQESADIPKAACARPPTDTYQTLVKLAIIAALSGVCPSPARAAMAQEALVFDIPGGSLSSALIEIGRRSGAIVSFSPSLVSGQSAAPVQGRFTPIQAFMQALGKSGLSIEVTPNGTVTVFPTPAAKPATKSATVRTGAQYEMPPTEDAPGLTLDPVIVVASAEAPQAQGLRASTASTATRTNTPLSELPQAVSVITRDALDLQGHDVTTTDALRHVTGVTAHVNDAGEGLVPSLMVRGLPAEYALSGMGTLRSGLSIDSALVERIEVLKGPSSVIGGAADLGGRGGVVNLVRKSIETQPYVELKQGLSSRDGGTLRTDLDAAGALAPGTYWRTVAYASRSGHTDSGHDPQYAGGLLGVLGYRGTHFNATLTLQTDNQRVTPAPTSRGARRLTEGGVTEVEPGQWGAVVATDGLRWRSSDIELDLGWQLSKQWRMTWKGRQERLHSDMSHHRYWIYDDQSDAGVDLVRRQTDARDAGMQWGLIGDLATGPIKHRLLAALDLDRRRLQQRNGAGATWYVDPATFEPGVTPFVPDSAASDLNMAHTRKRRRAVLLQDQLHLGNSIARLAVQRAHSFEDYAGIPLQGPHATNWDAGLLHQITPTFSVYAGRQYSIEIDGRGTDFQLYDGTEAPLRELRQTQAGTKLEMLEHRLALTLEAFQLRQLNTAYNSFELNGSGRFSIPGRSSNGMEVELSGQASPSLDMKLGLTFIRAREVQPGPDSDTPQTVDLPTAGVPARSLSVLTRYRLPGTELSRNSVGLAFRAYSSSWAVPPNPTSHPVQLQLPGGAQLDLSWMHTALRWTLRASIDNVFDRQLYGTQSTADYIPLQPRRSLGLSATFLN